MLSIITIPQYEKALRQISKPLDHAKISSPHMQKFFDELGATMIKADGLGLAAPQVNTQLRVIAVNINDQAQIFINPKILKKSFFKNVAEEGCLSIPNRYEKVKRNNHLTLEYTDRHGVKHQQKFSDLTARVFLHEIDHLDGILFIDKIVK